jgi:multidrug efflux pump subunit AcrB
MIGRPAVDRGSGRVQTYGGAVSWSSTVLTGGVLETMFLTRLKTDAVVLLASCAIAGLATLATKRAQDHQDDGRPFVGLAAAAGGDPDSSQGLVADAAAKAAKSTDPGDHGEVKSKGRLFAPDRTLMFVNFYTTNPKADPQDPNRLARNLEHRLWIRGVGSSKNLGERTSVMRVRLDPDRMQAHKLSTEDIARALMPSRLVTPKGGWLEEFKSKPFQLTKYDLIDVEMYSKPEQYKTIILKASPEGEILRLKDLGRAELVSTLFDVSADVDGHPAATIVLGRAPASSDAEVIEAVKEKLKRIKANANAIKADNDESWPAGMESDVIPFDSRRMIYAVIETPRGSTRESTTAKCQELGAIAKRIDEISSVTSLAGYQIRTERGDSNAGTCLIHLKDRSDRKLTSRQIIETLEEKCRTLNVHIEFFEPPAVSAFVAAGGFSVRVLDKANLNNDERPGRGPMTLNEDLLNRKDLASFFNFLAGSYAAYEIVIDNDIAVQKGVSIACAMENLAKAVGGDVQAERRFRSLVEVLSHSFVKNDRGEMVPYRLFMQLKNKLGLNDSDG